MKTMTPLLIVLSLAVITACGGGSGTGDTQTANGGIGGTGVSQGPVTGFGSVYVNGVKYETNNALFVREDANMSTQADFGLGEYVTVKGMINADGVTGTATEVSFEDLIEGPISSVDPNAGSLVILGQTVTTDRLTINLGFSLLSDLQAGNVVEVSGSHDANGNILATAIRLKGSSSVSASKAEVKGTISNLNIANETFVLSETGLVVSYSTAQSHISLNGGYANGQRVEVKSTTPYDGTVLLATTIEIESDNVGLYGANTEVEIEGVVTRFGSLTDFAVNGLAVITTGSTEFESGSGGVATGVRVKVEGVINADGVLVADEVDLREASNSAEVKANIDAIDVAAGTITVLGSVYAVDNYTIRWEERGEDDFTFALSDLFVGQYVALRYNVLADGRRVATRIKIEDDSEGTEDTELEGFATQFDSPSQTFVMSGVTVQVVGSTQFDGFSSSNDFFATATASTKLEVKGMLTVSGMNQFLTATEIELED